LKPEKIFFMENKSLRWCEISDHCDKVRFEALSAAIKTAGRENSVEFIETTQGGFAEALLKAENEFDGIRLGGEASEWIFSQTERMPSLTASLQCADAIASEKTAAGVRWWSRSFLLDGLNRTLASAGTTPDISGSIFILGAKPVSRILVAAFARVGFSRFNIVDPDETKAQLFCESLKRRLFGLEIHSVARHYMTQLPGIHSIAANVLEQGKDEGTLQELYYFNFLKPGGIWLDLPLTPFNSSLEAEAHAVGAIVIDPSTVIACTDAIWAEECFGIEIDSTSLSKALDQARKPAPEV
jgi:hypothetical protein